MKDYTYDANGNQTAVKSTKTGKTLNYAYDAENRLEEVSITKDGTTAQIQRNTYNGEGQRIQKIEGDQTINYYYQDGTVSYTTDGNGSQTGQNLIGLEGNIIGTQRYEENSTAYYTYHKDIQGSTTTLMKEDGSVDASYEYTDFGETTVHGDNKAGNEVCYTGGIYDSTTGLYYLNARYYNPEDGRFLTEDTYRGETKEPDTWHLYAYCKNNPVNYTDPSGHKYNINKAVAYARKWAKRKNPKYKDHGKTDCTNFISQCVYAGGKSMNKVKNVHLKKDLYKTNNYWYSVRYMEYHVNYGYYRWKETTTWTTVAGFYTYWKRHGTKSIYCKNIKTLQIKAKKGDIVQIYPPKETWNHAIIITSGKKGNWKYCGHSYERKDRAISNIKRKNRYRILRIK